MKPCTIPNCSSSTLATGAKQFVVHEPTESTVSLAAISASFTPYTIVLQLSLAGAEISTFLAPCAKCLLASAALFILPVHSSTISTPSFAQSSCATSRVWVMVIGPCPIFMLSPSWVTSPRKRPCTESYCNKCAWVSVGAGPLMAIRRISFA